MQHGGDKIGDVYLSKKQKRLGMYTYLKNKKDWG
jgi:hypothetical protein